MSKRIVRVSTELLKSALYLPDNASIVGVSELEPFIDLVVESPDFSEEEEGKPMGYVMGTYKCDADGKVRFDCWLQ